MTLLEKIKNYKWFDSPNKLRTILEELYNSIGGGSGGGNQDLQSVLDNGGYTYRGKEDNTNFIDIAIDYEVGSDTPIFNFSSRKDNKDAFFSITNGKFSIREGDLNTSGFTTLSFNSPLVDTLIKFPAKYNTGTYTLATLDDIKKIDLAGRVYVNNAAAISGGLTANDVYRTATGELRIVV